MKSNELRIGNYIVTHLGKIDAVESITETEIFIKNEYSIMPLKLLSPIPLTEEWLLKFGGEQPKENDFIIELNNEMDLYINNFNNEYKIYLDSYFKADIFLLTIKHVHQLQNLYFALTGEELKIKEK